jgi:hypothetical protein
MGGEASGGGLTLPALEFWRREKKEEYATRSRIEEE